MDRYGNAYRGCRVYHELALGVLGAAFRDNERFLPPDPAGSGRRSYSPVLARPQPFWPDVQSSKSAARRDKSRECNVSKQK
jgi:hypothetical protein